MQQGLQFKVRYKNLRKRRNIINPLARQTGLLDGENLQNMMSTVKRVGNKHTGLQRDIIKRE